MDGSLYCLLYRIVAYHHSCRSIVVGVFFCLGALIAKNSAERIMKKTYFGGGSIQVYVADRRFHVLRTPLSEKYVL